MTQKRINFRRLIYENTSEEDFIAIWAQIKEQARAGNQTAQSMLLDRLMGKPSVGGANNLIDDLVIDHVQALDNLSPSELDTAYQIIQKIQAHTLPHVDATPAPGHDGDVLPISLHAEPEHEPDAGHPGTCESPGPDSLHPSEEVDPSLPGDDPD